MSPDRTGEPGRSRLARLPWRRVLPPLAAAAYLAAVLIWARGDRRAARSELPRASVWNTGDDGLSLAFAYLRARAAGRRGGAGVTVLRRAIDAATVPAGAVVLRIAPDPALAEALTGRPHEGSGSGPGGGAGPGGDDRGGNRGNGGNGGNGARNDEGAKDGGDTTDSGHGSGGVGNDREETRDTGSRSGASVREALLTPDEERWVEGGGRLVLAVAGRLGPLGAAPVEHPRAQPPRKAFPIWPGVVRLLPRPRRTLTGPPLAAAQALWLDGDAPVAVRLGEGRGDVILLACPEVFFNDRLGEADHLALLAALAEDGADRAGGTSRPVLFDERLHLGSDRGGALEILTAWGFAPLLLLAAVAVAVACWRRAVRLGPPDREAGDDRSDAVELVDALADLYDRALGRADALRLYHESFVRTVAADTGLRGAALAARAGELAAGFSPADLPPPPSPTPPPPLRGPAPAGAAAARGRGRARQQADIPHAAFDRGLRLLNQAFRRLDDAERG